MKTGKALAQQAKAEPGKKVRRVRVPLRSLVDCRREIGRLYRAGLAGTMAVDDVRQLAAVLRIAANMIADDSIEARIAQLEEAEADRR